MEIQPDKIIQDYVKKGKTKYYSFFGNKKKCNIKITATPIGTGD